MSKIPPNLPLGIEIHGENSYEKNVSLKTALNALVTKAPHRKQEIIYWYINDWGGIKTNRSETIAGYLRTPEFNEQRTAEIKFDGIASYSKALTILAVDEYAIYDARVAYAINAIDILYNGSRGYLYPCPKGRSSDIAYVDIETIHRMAKIKSQSKLSVQSIKSNVDRECLPKNKVYWYYWKFLKRLIKEMNMHYPSEAEMVLFASKELLHSSLIEYIRSGQVAELRV